MPRFTSSHVIYALVSAVLVTHCSRDDSAPGVVHSPTTTGSQESLSITPSPVHEFELYLATLDTFDFQSVQTAARHFREAVAPSLDSQVVDSLFPLFHRHQRRVARAAGEVYESGEMNLRLYRMERGEPADGDSVQLAIEHTLSQNGFTVGYAEGHVWVFPDVAFLQTLFSPYCTAGLREYMSLQLEEEMRPRADDGVRLLPMDEIATRMLRYEELADQHPQFALRDDVEARRLGLLHWFLMDTEASWDTSGALLPETKDAFERFLEHHRNTRSGAVVADFYALLVQNGFRMD